jgi:hypothetical protein
MDTPTEVVNIISNIMGSQQPGVAGLFANGLNENDSKTVNHAIDSINFLCRICSDNENLFPTKKLILSVYSAWAC